MGQLLQGFAQRPLRNNHYCEPLCLHQGALNTNKHSNKESCFSSSHICARVAKLWDPGIQDPKKCRPPCPVPLAPIFLFHVPVHMDTTSCSTWSCIFVPYGLIFLFHMVTYSCFTWYHLSVPRQNAHIFLFRLLQGSKHAKSKGIPSDKVCNVQCAVCGVQCTVFSVQCVPCVVQTSPMGLQTLFDSTA